MIRALVKLGMGLAFCALCTYLIQRTIAHPTFWHLFLCTILLPALGQRK